MPKIKSFLFSTLVGLSMSFFNSSAHASADCPNQFPNYITDVCWSCMFPIKIFGGVTVSGFGEDYETVNKVACACANPPKLGVPMSFWEMTMMTDSTSVPGCFPLLGGAKIDIGVNKNAYGYTEGGAEESKSRQTSFRQVNLYINPLMYVIGAVLDNSCMDRRGFDIPWISVADPTHNDEELANILTPYAFPFGSLEAIGAITADAVAASAGFPIAEIFWAAGSYGGLYPLTGTNSAHVSNEQSSRLQTTRVLAKLHAAGTQWSASGDDSLCGYIPQIIMDKRQYKFTRLYPLPQTKKTLGTCCDPIGRTTILVESGTEAPLNSFRDMGHAIFRKRDCCSGAF